MYTMEYYSAIKKNTFESVLMRWMKLEPIIQSEVSWVPKNWCFWTVVLEKTLESPLDCKEIQPVHSKGDQSWVFFGRNDTKAETPILWPPHAKSWLIGKDSDAGRDWRQEEKGATENEMAGWHHWLHGCEFGWTSGVGGGQGGLACYDSWGLKESDTTELNWTEFNPFTLKVIVDMYDSVPIFLIVLGLFFVGLFLLWYFLPKEVPLAFVINLVWWCQILLTFACLESFWLFCQFWMRILLAKVFLVVGSSLSSL